MEHLSCAVGRPYRLRLRLGDILQPLGDGEVDGVGCRLRCVEVATLVEGGEGVFVVLCTDGLWVRFPPGPP